MSTERDDMLALRSRLMVGDPPYEIDPFLQTKVRKSGAPGFEELRDIGNYDAGASANILALDACIQIIDHLLGRIK